MAKRDFDDFNAQPPDELAAALDTAERASIWVDAIRAHALEKLQSQVRIPGWTLEPTRPQRQWREPQEVMSVLSALGLPRKDMQRTDILSPAQMEKLVRKQLSNTAWDKLAERFVKSVSSGVKLARDPTTTSPVDDFPAF